MRYALKSKNDFCPPFLDNDRQPAVVAGETAHVSVLSAVQKAVNFATSAARHVAAGAPRCTDEQIAERFAICQTCEFLKGGACEKCGCAVSRERAYVSKLSWAGESCPVGKWGPVPPAG